MSEPQEPRDDLSDAEREEVERYVEAFRRLPAPQRALEDAVARMEGWWA